MRSDPPSRRLRLLFLVGLLAGAGDVVGGQNDSLWQRALKFAEASSDIVPGTAEVRFENLAADGSVKCVYPTTLRWVLAEDGTVRVEQIRSGSLDEKLSAESCGVEWARRMRMDLPLGDSPFRPWQRRPATARNLGRTREIDGRLCSIYEVRWKTSLAARQLVQGTTCLDATSGAPLVLQYSPVKLPRGVALSKTTIRYVDDGALGWWPVEMELELKEDGNRGRAGWARLRAALKEHWRPAPPPGDGEPED